MSNMRTVSEIDQSIDAIHEELIRRAGPFDEMSAAAWQAAWDAHPELQQQERALYSERYDAQRTTDKIAARDERRQSRKISKPQRIAPKSENVYGDSFKAWQVKFEAALTAEQTAIPARTFQVGAFNCNYLPEIAAYEAVCAVNPARRLRLGR